MLIKYTDVTGQAVWTVASRVMAVTIPSPIAVHGDGKCRIFVEGGLASEVSRAEAERFVAAINEGTK
jgi:hypothetical protein